MQYLGQAYPLDCYRVTGFGEIATCWKLSDYSVCLIQNNRGREIGGAIYATITIFMQTLLPFKPQP